MTERLRNIKFLAPPVRCINAIATWAFDSDLRAKQKRCQLQADRFFELYSKRIDYCEI